MKKEQKNGFGIVGIVIISLAVVVLAGGALWLFRAELPIGPVKYWFRNPINWSECVEAHRIIPEPPHGSCEYRGAVFPAPESRSNAPNTSNWKTYRNEQYGFAFHYPPMYQLDSESFSDTTLLPIYVYDQTNVNLVFAVDILDPQFRPQIESNGVIISPAAPLKEYVEALRKDFENESYSYPEQKIGNVTSALVDGEPAYQFSFSGGPGLWGGNQESSEVKEFYTFISRGGLKWMISFSLNDKQAHGIFSTFKFIPLEKP